MAHCTSNHLLLYDTYLSGELSHALLWTTLAISERNSWGEKGGRWGEARYGHRCSEKRERGWRHSQDPDPIESSSAGEAITMVIREDCRFVR